METGVREDANKLVGKGTASRSVVATNMSTSGSPGAVSPCQSLVGAACHLLGQCRDLVGALPDASFVAPSARLGGGTIGQHLRHTLDHYHAIVGAKGLIDYDHRERDVPMETDRAEALRVIDAMCARLHAIGEGSDALPVAVRVMISGDGSELQLSSTLGRELAFATHHAVHHQAMMRSIAIELGVAVAPHFGRAPSTIHFERGRPG